MKIQYLLLFTFFIFINEKIACQHFNEFSKLRSLSKKEQFEKSDPYHKYDNLLLKRIDPLVYEFKDKGGGYRIREHYPGILFYSYLSIGGLATYSCYRLDFYNEQKKLNKSINLEGESPYQNDKYNIISVGYPNLEFYKIPAELDSNEPITGYLTVNEVNSNPNGYTIVEYQIIPVNNFKILGWEETLVGYDRYGSEIFSITIPFDTHDAWVSNNGKYLIFTYGGSRSDNPINYNSGGLKIYDIQTSKIIYEEKDIPNIKIKNLVETDNNYLSLGLSHPKTNNFAAIRVLFDLENRERYELRFNRQEWNDFTKKFKSYKQCLNDFPFKKTTF